MLVVLFLLFFIQHCFSIDNPPGLPYHMGRYRRYQGDIILNLTYLLCKDATIKLWHADRVQQKFLGSLSYQLGAISAGIQDTFRRMVKRYRKFSNLTGFRGSYYHRNVILSAYHLVKGDYNTLLIEKELFNDVLRNHKDRARIGVTTRKRGRGRGKQYRRSLSLPEKEAMLKRRLDYEKLVQDDPIDIDDIMMGDID